MVCIVVINENNERTVSVIKTDYNKFKCVMSEDRVNVSCTHTNTRRTSVDAYDIFLYSKENLLFFLKNLMIFSNIVK